MTTHAAEAKGTRSRLSHLDRALLAGYLLSIAASIFIAPRQPGLVIDMLGPIADAIPATRRLVEISAMPGKTIIWVASSIGFSPLVLYYVIRRFQPMSDSELKAARRGALIACIFLLPWLFVTGWRPHMSRGGAWISSMGASELLLIVFGCLISFIYAEVLAGAAVAVLKSMRRA